MRRIVLAAVAAAGLAGCGYSKEEYGAKAAEAERNLKQVQDESAKVADLERKVAAQQGQIAALEARAAEAGARLAETEQAKVRLEAEKQAMQAQYDQLTRSLKKEIAEGNIQVQNLKGKMLVRLSERILFRSGSAAINREGKLALDKVAESFKTLTGKSVIVTGFTDDVPVNPETTGFASNWELSTGRALSVVRYLQSKGVDPRMLGAAGGGEYHPVAPNDTPVGRQQNRRIEIVLAPAEVAMP
jgi:chemotaxis protein MotB